MPRRAHHSTRGRTSHRRFRAPKRGFSHLKHGVKLASSFYPRVTKVRVKFEQPWHNSTAVAAWTYSNALQFSLNGLWRPTVFCDNEGKANINTSPPNIYASSVTAGGGLLGSDTSGAPYRQYRVSRCHITLELLNNSAKAIEIAGDVPMDHDIWPPGIPAPNVTVANQRYGMLSLLLPPAGGMNKPVVVRRTFHLWKMSGLTKEQWLSDRGDGYSYAVLFGGVGSGTQHAGLGSAAENPTMYPIWSLGASKPDGTAMAANDWSWRCTMVWDVVLFKGNDVIVPTGTPSDPAPTPDDSKDDDEEDEVNDSLDGLPPELLARFAKAMTGRATKKVGPSSASAPPDIVIKK